MKKVFVLSIMLFAVMVSARAERTVIFEGDSYVHVTEIPLTMFKDGVLLSLYGTVHTDGLFMFSDHQSSLSTDIGSITSIVFEGQGSVTFTFSEGSYDTIGNNGYWGGNAASVTFVPSANIKVHRIIVTVDDSDGISDLSLCDMQSLQSQKIYLSSRELVVLHQAGSYLFVKDRLTDCYGLVKDDVEQTYALGDVIPGGWGGKMMTYDNEPYLIYAFGFKPAVENIEVIPDEITPVDVDHDYWAHYVVLRNVMISDDGTILTDKDGNEAPIYKWTHGAMPPEQPDAAPNTDDLPSCSCNECAYMKLNTLAKLYNTLRYEWPEVKVEPEVIEKARRPINEMLRISKELGIQPMTIPPLFP